MNPESVLPALLGLAWLLPLASFAIIVLLGRRLGKEGVLASYVATSAILSGFVLSAIAMLVWLGSAPAPEEHHEDESHASSTVDAPLVVRAQDAGEEHAAPVDAEHDDHAAEHGEEDHHAGHHAEPPRSYSGDWYLLGEFGDLRISIGYYVDALTVTMFCMVTFIATCIHFYAVGYMHDELHDVDDHEVTLEDGGHLHRRGRFHRFFQYLSLFCFSMLGIVIAGNIAMVFVFWELVGVCSYFLIGFYFERHSASCAANKAFIVNRVGDFGMIIGLMALWGSLGTFSFGDWTDSEGNQQAGIFSQVRPEENEYQLRTPDGMVRAAASEEVAQIVAETGDLEASETAIAEQIPEWRDGPEHYGYALLVIAGLGIFCGCVGKSAQFPLHVWLPDAMEGPTPVSALVHSATMVAAGVYLVGRFFPVFTPEVLLAIAYIGAITLFIAATIAIVATDIKRVLAYSTVSQLGYMMLALGIGGWVAGMFHLITHAFFKSLLFMGSGSVIHACHTNEMTKMGGLRHKMPWTAYTMLVGCLAIIGAGIPFVIGFSGYYSKDAIIEQALSFTNENPAHRILFLAAAGGAAITAFYMFRLWFMTFAGPPRDERVYEHAHESPKVMYLPLVVLSVFAIGVGWQLPGLPSLAGNTGLLEQARPAGTLANVEGGAWLPELTIPDEHLSHVKEIKIPATLIAFSTALGGVFFAAVFYGWRLLDPEDARRQFFPVHRFLLHKWWFDELYEIIFIRPAHVVARLAAGVDKNAFDRLIDGTATFVRGVSDQVDRSIDRPVVDGLANKLAQWTYSLGLGLRVAQTGSIRQYVMFIVVGTAALFLLVSFFWNPTWAGN